ncbi:Response regulator receiver domain-containing protein [Sphingomonas guangdongensis]|uniref:Response regulator receiver domain-containing protein n=1 Tax=Sphingomonas guangdongensis TaxID=1141890 RepID=A0A285R1Z4_9SPHN|nr:response regulator [Sphingomonas guangdongensis]SOB87739.1 Response regulator receiver domain-containing protein [Sphingomonas guangdongensis]
MLFGKKERRISRILIVEDEPLVAFDTEHFLSSEGFEIVATLDTVADAQAVIGTGVPIDLVLVDVNLSDGSGVEVARLAHGRGIKVLFVTGTCPGDARALAAGCLAKPYPQRDLLAAVGAIEKVLAGKAPKRLPQSFSLFLAAA